MCHSEGSRSNENSRTKTTLRAGIKGAWDAAGVPCMAMNGRVGCEGSAAFGPEFGRLAFQFYVEATPLSSKILPLKTLFLDSLWTLFLAIVLGVLGFLFYGRRGFVCHGFFGIF